MLSKWLIDYFIWQARKKKKTAEESEAEEEEEDEEAVSELKDILLLYWIV